MSLARWLRRSLFGSLALCGLVHGATFVTVSGDPGSLQLPGQQVTIQNPALSEFVVSSDWREWFASGNGHGFTMDFANVRGQPLVAGTYERARDAILRPANHPGLTFVSTVACDIQSFGRFVVYEIAYAADNYHIGTFAADFEFHCSGEAAAVFGGIRINSDIPYVQLPRISVSSPTFLQLDSEAGDPLGRGQHLFMGTDNTSFSPNSFAGPEFQMRALPLIPPYLGDRFWDLQFGGLMSRTAIPPGSYTTSNAWPGLEIHNGGTYCNGWTGQFQVREDVRDDDGLILAFATDFRYQCAGATGALVGAIRFNSGVPYSPTAAPPPSASQLALLDSTTHFLVQVGDTMPALRVRTLDASGAVVPNTSVHFQLSASCGHASADVISDSTGLAALPAFTASASGLCVVTAQLPSTSAQREFDVDVYGAADIAFTQQPATVLNATAGQLFQFTLGASARGYPLASKQVSLTVVSSGAASATVPSLVTTDSQGAVTVTATANDAAGSYQIVANMSGATAIFTVSQLLSAASPTTPVHQVTAPSPSGTGSITLSISSPSGTCNLAPPSLLMLQATTLGGAPVGMIFPQGIASIRADGCAAGETVAFSIDYPQAIPPTAALWRYGPTSDNRAPHWYAMPATFGGRTVQFNVTDGVNDDDFAANGTVTLVGALVIPGGVLQDLWWGGSAEDGWGVSLVQHGDIVFAIIYAYDSAGHPTWFAMPGGKWDASHTSYSGSLYQPHGSPYFQYDASHLTVGSSVGTATLTLLDENNARLDYVIGGAQAHKSITRQLYGSPDSTPRGSHADMWWGGATQDGWGMAVLQQYGTLFAAWFTYDANGAPTWFVMPGGTWTAADTYEGSVFRTTSSPWLGVTYDATRLQPVNVGTFRFRFNGETTMVDYGIEGHTGTLMLSRQPF